MKFMSKVQLFVLVLAQLTILTALANKDNKKKHKENYAYEYPF